MTRLTDEDVLRLQMLSCQLEEGGAPHGETTRKMLGGILAQALDELRDQKLSALSAEEFQSLRDASTLWTIALVHCQQLGERKGAESAARILAVLAKLTRGEP